MDKLNNSTLVYAFTLKNQLFKSLFLQRGQCDSKISEWVIQLEKMYRSLLLKVWSLYRRQSPNGWSLASDDMSIAFYFTKDWEKSTNLLP